MSGYGASPRPGQDDRGGGTPYGSSGGGHGFGGPSGSGGYGAGGHGGDPYGAGSRGQAPPVCPRHPDRVSYITCQRCGRPACTECQRPATVGVHCVDCVRAASRGARQVRTAGGGVDRGGTPVVTYTIMAICIVIELLRYLAPDVYWAVVTQLIFWPSLGAAEPYRFLTSTFLHGGIWHLAFNMYALYLVGTQLERYLGRLRYAVLYLLAAVGGSVGYLLIAGVDAPGAVGASGGVFGLFAAFAVVQRRLGGDPRQILLVIGINAVIGFLPGMNIAWQAHLGGLVVGGVVAALFAYLVRERQWLAWVGSGVIAVAMAGLSAVLLA